MKLQNRVGLRVIALFEGVKALLMLITLLVFMFVFHLNAAAFAVALVSELHINPRSHYVSMLLMLAAHFSRGQLVAACVCAFLYVIIKMSESIGLWHQRPWGRTLGIASIGVLIPYEGYALLNQYTHFKFMVLLINTAIVVYLLMFFNRRGIQ